MPIAREISDMLDIGKKLSQVISGVFLTSKIAKITQDKCSHCVIGRLLLSIAIDGPIA